MVVIHKLHLNPNVEEYMRRNLLGGTNAFRQINAA
jgi:hypothetical protein